MSPHHGKFPLTDKEKDKIQELLRQGMSVEDIARRICRSHGVVRRFLASQIPPPPKD